MSDIRYEAGMPEPPPAVGEVRLVRTQQDRGFWLEIGRKPRAGSKDSRTKRLWISDEELPLAIKVLRLKLPAVGQAVSSLNGQPAKTPAAPKPAGTGGKA